MLAVDLDQRRAERLQRLHAHRLIVDEGAGAAVGELHAAQDQRLVGGDVAFSQQCARRMPRRQLEHRGDLALLGALAHQRGVAARAERQREGIEQDRLAGAGLAGQHGKARREIDVEPVDQNDVSDRKPGQHGRPSHFIIHGCGQIPEGPRARDSSIAALWNGARTDSVLLGSGSRSRRSRRPG